MRELDANAPPETRHFVMNQTMLRIRDPDRSLNFYCEVLGMSLFKQLDFPAMKFTLYFLGYLRESSTSVPSDPVGRTAHVFGRPAMLELTHNWGTESDPGFSGYHNGNKDPRGFGHIGISVPDVDVACARFAQMCVPFVKKPDEGTMKGLAFIVDPDGYWIEILSAATARAVL